MRTARQGRGRGNARRGFTLVELVVAMATLTVVLGAVALAALSGNQVYNTGRTVEEMETNAQRAIDRIADELREAGAMSLFPNPAAGSSFLEFQTNEGFVGGAVQWSPVARIGFEYSPREVDDGVDNDSNGLVDEGRVVWRRSFGAPDEQAIVLANWVSEMLEGEDANVLDDNGNGLLDEGGLCFDVDAGGETLTIRLTLARRDSEQRLITRTVETSIGLRN